MAQLEVDVAGLWRMFKVWTESILGQNLWISGCKQGSFCGALIMGGNIRTFQTHIPLGRRRASGCCTYATLCLSVQDGPSPPPNFWPQFMMGQGGMVPPGQVPPMAGGPAIARYPSGSVRPSLPAPLLIPVPAQPLHHAQSGGPLIKQMQPGAKPATSETLSTKVGTRS